MLKFNNLDQGYEQCNELYSSIKGKGTELLGDLNLVVTGLKEHWKGSDATLHINRLVDIHASVNTFVKDTGNLIAYAANQVVEVQEVRRANGASANVGSRLEQLSEQEGLIKAEETAEYYCTSDARNDYEKLVEVKNKFSTFTETVLSQGRTLMTNWIDGNGRNDVNNNLNNFETISEEFKNHIEDARSNLETAIIENLSQIMEE